MLKVRVTFRVMKLGCYVTVDDGGNYVTECSHKDKKNNNNSSQQELGPPVSQTVLKIFIPPSHKRFFWFEKPRMSFLVILVFFRLEIGQISLELVKNAFTA